MAWVVLLTANVHQKLKKIPRSIDAVFQFFLAEIRLSGPVQVNWPNYGKLRENCYHCHLQRGRPTYVAVWKVLSKKDKLIEVTYVGSHEKARYERLC